MSTETRRTEIADIHTHILPRFDDGSGSSAESFSMLAELYRQGVGRVVLTPHFYARRDEPDLFVSSRDAAAEHLVSRIGELLAETQADGKGEIGLPSIYLGAEVAFFHAMSICPELEMMCIRGTRYLLVEMPFDRWSSAMLGELYTIKKKRRITPIIAHIERYFSLFSRGMLDEMISNGILVQVNAEAFLRMGTRRRALKLLEDGKMHLLGSDCHNMDKRAPNIGSALEVIGAKLGSGMIDRLCENSQEILGDAKPIRSQSFGR